MAIRLTRSAAAAVVSIRPPIADSQDATIALASVNQACDASSF
jgi:hypothetical protein